MSKQIEHIDCPKEWESTNDWDSHKEFLWLCLEKVKPNFTIECGCGDGSTLLLDKYCKSFVSYETNTEWFNKILPSVPYSLLWVDDWGNLATQECDLLFVDCAPGEIRKDIILRFANEAQVIIAHDTEPGAEYVYGMSEVLNRFKYRLDYQPKGKPHTTAVSNFINIEEWVK